MRFAATPIPGCWVVEPEEQADERGFFARLFSRDEFSAHGLNPELAQSSISFNRQRSTLRGMHWQEKPHEEAKLVRCTQGAIFDVALDLRHGSPAYLKWYGVELTAKNRRMLYIPEGCAHGLLTLADDTEVQYSISEFHHPESARGARFDDPAFGITWPEPVRVISARDSSYPDFRP
jgi:dTDP-4-dehydrorhamnose 3,5-epimerase